MRFAKMLPLNSLRTKVLLAYVAGMVLSIGLIIAIALWQQDALARLDLAGATEDMADHVVFDAQGRPVGFDMGENELNWIFDTLHEEMAYRVLDETGNVALVSHPAAVQWPTDEAHNRLARGVFSFEHRGVATYGVTERIQRDGRTWYLQVVVSDRFMELLHRVAMPLVGTGIAVFGLVLLLAFGLCAFITLRFTLQPLRDVSASAAAISPRSFHTRLSTRAVPQEIAPLVDSFNRALERLEQGYRVQQTFLATSAHELKTPLALIRAQIELRPGADEHREPLLRDIEYMSRQVQQLLLLAEASEAHNYRPGTVRVQEVVHEAVFFLQRMAEQAQVHFTVYSSAVDVKWQGDRGALFTLLKNLLENAVQHAPAGTDVGIDIRGDHLTVRDEGPGVAPEQLPRLFERFWRGAHRRDQGAGLGLAICQEIALAHGWRLVAEHAEPGLRFRLSTRPAPAA